MPAKIMRRYLDIQFLPQSGDKVPYRRVAERKYPVIRGHLPTGYILCQPASNMLGHESDLGVPSRFRIFDKNLSPRKICNPQVQDFSYSDVASCLEFKDKPVPDIAGAFLRLIHTLNG